MARSDDWLYDWWVTMRVTIVLLLLAIPLAVVGVIVLSSNSPFMLVGGTYTVLALMVGFVVDNIRLSRRRRRRV